MKSFLFNCIGEILELLLEAYRCYISERTWLGLVFSLPIGFVISFFTFIFWCFVTVEVLICNRGFK